jgi:3'(2'), 5'-bisphosphate nucleotidase
MSIPVGVTRAALARLVFIAHEAGQSAMRFYTVPLDVEMKRDDSPVTAADRIAHSVIVRELIRWDGTPIISEEGAIPPYEERRGWRRFWLVDPLDGTKEFVAANGEFTVNVALIDDGEPVLGVVFAPALDTTYFAGRGLGSWRSIGGAAACRLCSGSRPRAVTRVVESRSHPSQQLEAFLATLGRFERIRLGSSLKFCRVAEGDADLYPRFGPTMEWDVAAGDCIYRNSGPTGRPRRSPLTYNAPSLTIPEFVVGEATRSDAPEGHP